jgi:Methyltransferase domain
MLSLPDLGEWVAGQTNRPLASECEVDFAVGASLMLGLPIHRDRWKTWDNLIAIWHAAISIAENEFVVDGGAVRGDSVFLPGMERLGFRSLWAINPADREPGRQGGIEYLNGDAANTGFRDGIAAFVASLSTIEHGVDVGAFLKESARILRPGGKLFVSFDYWKDAIDCGGREAFGAPVKIFDRYDVWSMVTTAATYGLRVSPAGSEVETRCWDKVVEWLGLRYTFHNLLFEKA